MKTDLAAYFYNAIHESIYAMSIENEEIINYYGDKEECTIENYFGAQTSGGKLYDSTEIFDESTYLCDLSDYEWEFEQQRLEAFNNYLVEICEEVDEDDLIDVSDKIELDSDQNPLFEGKNPDFTDMEFSTEGSSLFNKIYSLMGECEFGQNVRVAAILAGAKYVSIDNSTDDYTLYFWKESIIEELSI